MRTTTNPATDRLWAEIVFIAYYLHWSFDSILELDHATRARVIEEIGAINAQLGGGVAPGTAAIPVGVPGGGGY